MDWNEINGTNLNKINKVKDDIKKILQKNDSICNKYYNQLETFKESTLSQFIEIATNHNLSVSAANDDREISAISIAYQLLFSYKPSDDCFLLVVKDNTGVKETNSLCIYYIFTPFKYAHINKNLKWFLDQNGKLVAPYISPEHKKNLKFYEKELQAVTEIVQNNSRIMQSFTNMKFYYKFNTEFGIKTDFENLNDALNEGIKIL